MECVSKSLLPNDAVDGNSVDLHDPLWRAAPYGWFSDEDDTIQPQRKKIKGADQEKRFRCISDKELDNLIVAKPPVNTEYSTNWALRNFADWSRQRNTTSTNKPVPENLLTSGSADDLNYWLSLYVVETRNKKGEPYPPRTLYQLLTGLHRHALTINPHAFNFLDKYNRAFQKLHNVIDNHFKALRKEGVGSDSIHTEIITKEEENKLWVSGVLGLATTPKALLRAVFFYNGKNFCLRRGQEHRNLKLSSFKRYEEPSHHYAYTENSSKNRQGGFAQLRVENKVVPIFSNSSAEDRCHVHILDEYISKLPAEVKEKDFFLRKTSSCNSKRLQ